MSSHGLSPLDQRKGKLMVQKFSLPWGGRELIIEVGRLAGQTNGTCTIQYGDTVVLVTAVMSEKIREGIDFFPLMVDCEEKMYAAGKIKSSRFIKRETRPSDEAILTGRLIDRSIRPLFDERLRNDIQVITTVLSVDGENDPDILSLVAASCALTISDIPWNGPIAGARVGLIPSEENPAGEWVLNPTYVAREKSLLDLVIAGNEEKITMIEASATEVSEALFLEATRFGQKHFGDVLKLISEVQAKVGRLKKPFEINEDGREETTPQDEEEALNFTRKFLENHLEEKLYAHPLLTKADRAIALAELAKALEEDLQKNNFGKERRKLAFSCFKKMVEEFVSQMILKKGKRIDGRTLDEIRPLAIEVGLLPRTHGSGLFSRGETQVLSIVTLGSPGDVQLFEGIEGSGKKRYMHHYNFPPYSVGETSPLRSPGRREIGHGALAEKAILPLLPSKEDFPYTIRVVSEVLSSNGSSSMGSACCSTLALMDAGVPLKKAVAGVAMGLASDKEGNYKIITDLQDLEDGKGGMDFKIAGTAEGITVAQMDTKTPGLTLEVIEKTLTQAHEGRLKILQTMRETISAPRADLSPFAPRIIAFFIKTDKIREVVGPGGKVINEIIAKTGVQIDIEQDGLVSVTAASKDALDKAVAWIKDIVREVQAGEIFEGKVTRLMAFGAFVEILPGQEGLVHISEMAWGHTNQVEDAVNIGDTVNVKVKEIDELGRINLTMKELLPKPDGFVDRPAFERPPRRPDHSRRPPPRGRFSR